MSKIADLNKRVPWISKLEESNREIKRLSNMYDFLLLKERFQKLDNTDCEVGGSFCLTAFGPGH
jgi:hypothetical protein